MSGTEQRRAWILTKLLVGEVTVAEAAALLQLSHIGCHVDSSPYGGCRAPDMDVNWVAGSRANRGVDARNRRPPNEFRAAGRLAGRFTPRSTAQK